LHLQPVHVAVAVHEKDVQVIAPSLLGGNVEGSHATMILDGDISVTADQVVYDDPEIGSAGVNGPAVSVATISLWLI
jgi:hypothetical protein